MELEHDEVVVALAELGSERPREGGRVRAGDRRVVWERRDNERHGLNVPVREAGAGGRACLR